VSSEVEAIADDDETFVSIPRVVQAWGVNAS
jgi:hypothetical protein